MVRRASTWTISDVLGLAASEDSENRENCENRKISRKPSYCRSNSREILPGVYERDPEKKRQRKSSAPSCSHAAPLSLRDQPLKEEDEDNEIVNKKEDKNELEETVKLLESKIISITSINAALEDQLDITMAENRKLLTERMQTYKPKRRLTNNIRRRIRF